MIPIFFFDRNRNEIKTWDNFFLTPVEYDQLRTATDRLSAFKARFDKVEAPLQSIDCCNNVVTVIFDIDYKFIDPTTPAARREKVKHLKGKLVIIDLKDATNLKGIVKSVADDSFEIELYEDDIRTIHFTDLTGIDEQIVRLSGVKAYG